MCAVTHGQDPGGVPAATITPTFVTREVTVDLPGSGQLAGSFTLPRSAAKDSKVPAVVFITGSGLQDRDETIFGHKPFLEIATHLANAGIASLRCDDRGFGKSTGDPSRATTLDFMEDAKAQLLWLKQQPQVDAKRVGVVGHSEGGLIGILLGQGPDPTISFAALLAPPGISGREILTGQTQDMYRAERLDPMLASMAVEKHRELMDAMTDGSSDAVIEAAMRGLVEAQLECALKTKPSPQTVELGVKQGMAQINTPWMKAFITIDPAVAMAKCGVPTLLLFGSKDVQVSPARNEPPLREAGASASVPPEIVVIDGVNHLFQPARTGSVQEYASIKVAIDPAVVKRIVDWVVAQSGEKVPLPTVSPKS